MDTQFFNHQPVSWSSNGKEKTDVSLHQPSICKDLQWFVTSNRIHSLRPEKLSYQCLQDHSNINKNHQVHQKHHQIILNLITANLFLSCFPYVFTLPSLDPQNWSSLVLEEHRLQDLRMTWAELGAGRFQVQAVQAEATLLCGQPPWENRLWGYGDDVTVVVKQQKVSFCVFQIFVFGSAGWNDPKTISRLNIKPETYVLSVHS